MMSQDIFHFSTGLNTLYMPYACRVNALDFMAYSAV